MRKKRFAVILVAMVTAFFMIAEPVVVSAATLSEIREDLKENREKLEAGQAHERSLSSQISELEQKIEQLDSAIAESEIKLKKLEKEVEEAQEKVDTQTENLNARLRNMYKTSTIGYLDVLLDSGSFSEFLTNLELVKIIYSADQDLLEELELAHQELEAKKKEAEELHAELEASKEEASANKSVIEAKKAEVAASNKETEKMIDELQADADAMTATIQGSGSSSSTSKYTGGVLAWPTPSTSYITSPFGYRIHPIYGYRKFHSGIDIGASYGSSIVAANDGRVILSGWNGGYGKCVVVDHGGGYTTLYAHCSSLLVSYGQSVYRGQKIAKVGSTGASTGPHLHFEVRINGNYKNPLNYVQ
ncbi:MAG: peptidoglycan DD-metalloendopeptidase family protein [Bacillota bacterium]|nr:peptidoglycan DD-metalloendopeptidase family protein [Bacillota bacterium]